MKARDERAALAVCAGTDIGAFRQRISLQSIVGTRGGFRGGIEPIPAAIPHCAGRQWGGTGDGIAIRGPRSITPAANRPIGMTRDRKPRLVVYLRGYGRDVASGPRVAADGGNATLSGRAAGRAPER